MRRGFAAFVFLVAAARVAAAPPERTHDVTPADYASIKLITEIALSPDGKQVAYVLSQWDKKSDRSRKELWVVDTDGKGKPTQLTKDDAGDSHPKWGADGKSIYVLAKRGGKDAKQQVWRVPLEGKPEAVTKVEGGVVAFDYAPKADTVFYTADAKAEDADDFSALRKKYDKIDYGHGKRAVSELFAVTEGGKETKKLIADNRYIREFAVTQDGKKVAMVTALDDTVIRSEGESRVDVWEEGKVVTPPTDVYRAKAASPYAWLENLAWSPEGTRFAFCAIHDAYPAEVIIGEAKDGKWATSRMPRKNDIQVRGYGSPLRWSGSTSLAFVSDRAGFNNIQGYDAAGGEMHGDWARQDKSVVFAFDVAADGGHAVSVTGTPERMGELFVWRRGEPPSRLVDPNPQAAHWKLPSVQHVTWKAPDGTTVGGPLELPSGWKKGDKPLPLVVAIHGGPTTASPNDLRFDPHNGRLYFAAAGYAVLCPNYRGSTGYGDKFLTDLVGNENDVEVKDILAGIQHLIKEGIADPDRIAVMGWSNGGYLTNCLITLKNPPVKIKAASSGAGILDTVAEWGFNDEPAYPMVFKKGAPWEQPDLYRKTSPIYGIGNVTAATLVHVGGNDVRCPPGHSRMLYRALREYRKVPAQLCEYPGQPHGLGTLSFRTAKMEWDLAWFEKYVLKK